MFRTAIAALIVAVTLTLTAGPAWAADDVCVGCPSSSTTSTTATTAPPQESGDPAQTLLGYLNQERRANGLPLFALRQDVTDIAVGWSRHLADIQTLTHNANYFSDATRTRLHGWALGEDLAAAPTLRGAHDGLMASPPHRQNILDGRFVVVGIGAEWRQGRWWITEDFLQPEPQRAAAPPAPPARPRPATPVASASPRPAPVAAPAPDVARSAPAPASTPGTSTLELLPRSNRAQTEPSSMTTSGTPPSSVPIGAIGVAAVALWLVGSASLTSALRRRRDQRRRLTRQRLRERIGSFGPSLPAAG
jgi:hypothetical protein